MGRRSSSQDRGQEGSVGRVSRRAVLASGGAAVAAGTLASVGVAAPAGAARMSRPAPLPKPIPGGVPLDPEDPEGSLIHWYLPGPEDAVSPILGLQGMGLDVEGSSITDFKGTSAFAIVSGEAKTNDGATQKVEFDVRVMKGTYISETGTEQQAAFAFL